MDNIGDIIGIIWITALAITLGISSIAIVKDIIINITTRYNRSNLKFKKRLFFFGILCISLFIVSFLLMQFY